MPVEHRPSFARDFPQDERLDKLVAAFARGDYLSVRTQALELEASDADEPLRSAARMLRERTKADPTAATLMAIAALLLVVLAAYWIVRAKPPANDAPSRVHVQHVSGPASARP